MSQENDDVFRFSTIVSSDSFDFFLLRHNDLSSMKCEDKVINRINH